MNDRKLKFERIKDVCQLKKEILSYLFDYVSKKPRDTWYRYTGDFKYEGDSYNLECECRWDNVMFTYRNLFIERKQIILNVDDVLANKIH